MSPPVALCLFVGLPGSGKTSAVHALRRSAMDSTSVFHCIVFDELYRSLLAQKRDRDEQERESQRQEQLNHAASHTRTLSEDLGMTAGVATAAAATSSAVAAVAAGGEESDGVLFESPCGYTQGRERPLIHPGHQPPGVDQPQPPKLPASDFDPDVWNAAQVAMATTVQNVMTQLKTVEAENPSGSRHVIVVEDNFYYRSMRRRYAQLARSLEVPFGIVYFDLSLKECLRRVDARNRLIQMATGDGAAGLTAGVVVPSVVVDLMAAKFQAPHTYPKGSNVADGGPLVLAQHEGGTYSTAFLHLKLAARGHKRGHRRVVSDGVFTTTSAGSADGRSSGTASSDASSSTSSGSSDSDGTGSDESTSSSGGSSSDDGSSSASSGSSSSSSDTSSGSTSSQESSSLYSSRYTASTGGRSLPSAYSRARTETEMEFSVTSDGGLPTIVAPFEESQRLVYLKLLHFLVHLLPMAPLWPPTLLDDMPEDDYDDGAGVGLDTSGLSESPAKHHKSSKSKKKKEKASHASLSHQAELLLRSVISEALKLIEVKTERSTVSKEASAMKKKAIADLVAATSSGGEGSSTLVVANQYQQKDRLDLTVEGFTAAMLALVASMGRGAEMQRLQAMAQAQQQLTGYVDAPGNVGGGGSGQTPFRPADLVDPACFEPSAPPAPL